MHFECKHCRTSYPSAKAARAGKTTQTFVTIPARISFLQPVSCTRSHFGVVQCCHQETHTCFKGINAAKTCPAFHSTSRGTAVAAGDPITNTYLDCLDKVFVVPGVVLSWSCDIRSICKRLLHFWHQWTIRPGFETVVRARGLYIGVGSQREHEQSWADLDWQGCRRKTHLVVRIVFILKSFAVSASASTFCLKMSTG